MKEILLFIVCWLVSGFIGWFLGMITDRMFYRKPKIELGTILLSMAIGPLIYLIILKSLFAAWADERKKKTKPNKRSYENGLMSLQDISKSSRKFSRPIRTILKTDKCDWCSTKKATITDGTYVYCSEECKKLFLKNALEAMEEQNAKGE